MNKTYGGVRLDVKSLTMCVRFKVFRLSVSALLSFSIRYEAIIGLIKEHQISKNKTLGIQKNKRTAGYPAPMCFLNNFFLDFWRGDLSDMHKVCTSGPAYRNETLVKAFENYSKAYIKVSVPVPFCLISLPWCIYVVQHCG